MGQADVGVSFYPLSRPRTANAVKGQPCDAALDGRFRRFRAIAAGRRVYHRAAHVFRRQARRVFGMNCPMYISRHHETPGVIRGDNGPVASEGG
jgi:hypothetical protein